MIARLGKEIQHEDSIYYWAWKNNIPVYSPALTDGSIGDMLYFHTYKSPGLILDLVADIRAMNDEAIQASPRKTGMIILGGGMPKADNRSLWSGHESHTPWNNPFFASIWHLSTGANLVHMIRHVKMWLGDHCCRSSHISKIMLDHCEKMRDFSLSAHLWNCTLWREVFPSNQLTACILITGHNTGVLVLISRAETMYSISLITPSLRLEVEVKLYPVGVAKHHICNANLFRNGADYAVFVNTAQPFDCSDSGADPDEAVSWGKIKIDAKPVKVYGDAAILLPLILSQTFAKQGHWSLKGSSFRQMTLNS